MSGKSGVRGYLLQTVVSLLSALQDNQRWNYLAVEPNNESEKVDIAWYFPDNKIKFTQVKSSQNQINLPIVKEWVEDFQKSVSDAEYELILIGPCSKEVANLEKLGSVLIPTPKPLDIDGMLEQASHKLDHYIVKRGFPQVTPLTREIIVNALITKLEVFSTSGAKVSREDFCNLIDEWIKDIIQLKKKAESESNKVNGMKFEEWVNALAVINLSNKEKLTQKDILEKEIFEWVNEVQKATKAISSGISQVTQKGKLLSKDARWEFYSDAKKIEEDLENIIVPPLALETHFALRESARHNRKAFGCLYNSDTEGFSREINLASKNAKEANRLFENVRKVL